MLYFFADTSLVVSCFFEDPVLFPSAKHALPADRPAKAGRRGRGATASRLLRRAPGRGRGRAGRRTPVPPQL